MAKNPEVQEKVRDEVNRVFPNNDINYENINQLEYMSNVINETLRLYPPVSVIPDRKIEEDTIIGDYFLPKGYSVSLAVYPLHHDKEIWGDDVEEFKPERWLDQTKEQKNVYLPFGGGARICIGMNFSLLEQKIFISKLLKYYRITLTEGSYLEISNFLFAPKSEYLSYRFEKINS